MKFSRQEYWSGLPFPSPGDLPNSGIEPKSPALQVDSLPSKPPVLWRTYLCVCVCVCVCVYGFLGGSDSEESACNAGGLGLIPGKGRSPGERKGNPLHYSWLEKSMDRGAWWATVHGVTKSQTWLSDWHTFSIYTNHFAVHLNLTQHCRSIILQLKQRKKKKNSLLVTHEFSILPKLCFS